MYVNVDENPKALKIPTPNKIDNSNNYQNPKLDP